MIKKILEVNKNQNKDLKFCILNCLSCNFWYRLRACTIYTR